jgi:4-hydroxybenzoate polyprenyltransferase
MLLQTHILLDKPMTGQSLLIGFVFGATLFGYHFTRTEPWQRKMAYLAGVLAFCCLLGLSRPILLQISIPVVVWALYYFAGVRSLRRIRWLKPVSIAFVWAWVTVWLPLDTQQWAETIWVFTGRAAFIFALALSCDLVDMHDDRQDQLTTLVQYLGEQTTFQWIDKAMVAAGLVCILNYVCKMYGLWAMSALLLSLGSGACWLRFLRNRFSGGLWHKLGIDACMLIQLMCVLLCKAIAFY